MLPTPIIRRTLAATLLVAAALAAPRAMRAQACDCVRPFFPTRWSVFVSAGGATFETAQMGVLLSTAGFAPVSNDAVGFGGGGFGSFGPLRLGAEHVRLDGGSESTIGGMSSRIEASYTTLTVGWDLHPRGRLSVAPTLGVGHGSYVLTVGDRAGGPAPAAPRPTFAEVLADPGLSSRITGAQWLFEPMLAAEMLVVRTAARRRGLTLGFRAGYRVAPNRPDWRYRGATTAGGPVDQAKGPILRLTFGIGGR